MDQIVGTNEMNTPSLPLLDEDDISEAVRSTNMLAQVSIATWGGVRSDSTLLNELKQKHNASGDVGRVLKNLLAGADGLLKQTIGAFMAVRSRHYQLTLPWIDDPHGSRQRGARLLPTALAIRYIHEISDLRNAAFAQLEAFLDAYPGLVKQAQKNLGTMAPLGTEYPTPEELRGSFRVNFDFEPLPDKKGFTGIGLPQDAVIKLGKVLDNKYGVRAEAAQRVVWERVREQVENLVKNLEKPIEEGKKARFKDATIENVRELLVLLPGWNLAKDSRITEIVADIEGLLDGVDPKDLRKNAIYRGDVAEQARKVADKMSSWGL